MELYDYDLYSAIILKKYHQKYSKEISIQLKL